MSGARRTKQTVCHLQPSLINKYISMDVAHYIIAKFEQSTDYNVYSVDKW